MKFENIEKLKRMLVKKHEYNSNKVYLNYPKGIAKIGKELLEIADPYEFHKKELGFENISKSKYYTKLNFLYYQKYKVWCNDKSIHFSPPTNFGTLVRSPLVLLKMYMNQSSKMNEDMMGGDTFLFNDMTRLKNKLSGSLKLIENFFRAPKIEDFNDTNSYGEGYFCCVLIAAFEDDEFPNLDTLKYKNEILIDILETMRKYLSHYGMLNPKDKFMMGEYLNNIREHLEMDQIEYEYVKSVKSSGYPQRKLSELVKKENSPENLKLKSNRSLNEVFIECHQKHKLDMNIDDFKHISSYLYKVQFEGKLLNQVDSFQSVFILIDYAFGLELNDGELDNETLHAFDQLCDESDFVKIRERLKNGDYNEKEIIGLTSKIKGQVGENIFIKQYGGEASTNGSQEGWDVYCDDEYFQVKIYKNSTDLLDEIKKNFIKLSNGDILTLQKRPLSKLNYAVNEDIFQEVSNHKFVIENNIKVVALVGVDCEVISEKVLEQLSEMDASKYEMFVDFGGVAISISAFLSLALYTQTTCSLKREEIRDRWISNVFINQSAYAIERFVDGLYLGLGKIPSFTVLGVSLITRSYFRKLLVERREYKEALEYVSENFDFEYWLRGLSKKEKE